MGLSFVEHFQHNILAIVSGSTSPTFRLGGLDMQLHFSVSNLILPLFFNLSKYCLLLC